MSSRQRNLLLFAGIVTYTLPFYLLSLKCFLHNDDLMALNTFVFQPFEKLVWGNIFFWTTTYRPLAGILYASLFQFFGTDPTPYYIAGFVIRIVNLALLFLLLKRITGNSLIAAVVTALSAIHWETSDAIYNFGAVFELLAFCFFLITFHLYLSFIENERQKQLYYLAAMLIYILALNSKEIAITLPLIIFVYEWIYKPGKESFWKRLLWFLPFVAVGGIYAIGKLYGKNAYLGALPFKYVLDAVVLKNLEVYFEKLIYNWIDFNLVLLLVVIFGTLVIALLFGNKEMLFGWCFFFITLIPVIGLRRVWGLYLYIPIAGITLYGICLFVEVVKRLYRTPISQRLQYGFSAALILVLFFIQYPIFVRATQMYFIQPGNVKRQFQQQMLNTYPTVPPRTAFGFRNAPLEGYNLHFLVWLSYRDHNLQIFRLPEQSREFLKASQSVESHVFNYGD